jgi:hypothetical protein
LNAPDFSLEETFQALLDGRLKGIALGRQGHGLGITESIQLFLQFSLQGSRRVNLCDFPGESPETGLPLLLG